MPWPTRQNNCHLEYGVLRDLVKQAARTEGYRTLDETVPRLAMGLVDVMPRGLLTNEKLDVVYRQSLANQPGHARSAVEAIFSEAFRLGRAEKGATGLVLF